jgi:protein-S-isoprenylcysteine O-methyltransferase Ste14
MDYSRAATPLTVPSDGVTSAPRRLSSSWPSFLVGAFLALAWSFFAFANLASWRETHHPTGLGASLLELTAAVFFLIRRPARVTSSSLLAWGATAVVTFGMLAARPGDVDPVAGLGVLWATFQLAGWGLAVICISTLGRSFGLVAANRGIVTSGPYRFVRHPVYSCYLLTQAGYVLENPTTRNFVVILATVLFQLVRIHTEEECLRQDPEYVAYRSRVQWRLIPRVY